MKNISHSFPLMYDNISKNDINVLIKFLKKNPKLTAGKQCVAFEKLWSRWLGTKYSVFVNSGSSANFLTFAALKYFIKNDNRKEIIVPSLTWNSDIVSVICNNFKPRFVDINLENLSMNIEDIKKKINSNTLAVFLSHIQGFNGIDQSLINILKKKKIYLIEDVCESHGAKFKKKKCGTFGLASNFSFYYAHHMSTIEGGMISTNNKKFYDLCNIMKGHGLVRESKFQTTRKYFHNKFKDLNKDFIFAYKGYNFRNNEIGATLGLNQLKRLNQNIKKRNLNMNFFLKNIDKTIYFKNFNTTGMSNYAFPIILKKKSIKLRNKFENYLKDNSIEFRRGNAGGGNQLRQPYLKDKISFNKRDFVNTEYVHHFGYYIGNYPQLKPIKLKKLLKVLNNFKHFAMV